MAFVQGAFGPAKPYTFTTTMAQDNFPALPGIYRVLFLYLEPSEPRYYRDIIPRSMEQCPRLRQ